MGGEYKSGFVFSLHPNTVLGKHLEAMTPSGPLPGCGGGGKSRPGVLSAHVWLERQGNRLWTGLRDQTQSPSFL